MEIIVQDSFANWIEFYVRPAFLDANIELTEPAARLFAYALQAQLEERIVPNQDVLLDMAKNFLSVAVSRRQLFPMKKLTFNRALHLLVEVNMFTRTFPWGSAV